MSCCLQILPSRLRRYSPKRTGFQDGMAESAEVIAADRFFRANSLMECGIIIGALRVLSPC